MIKEIVAEIKRPDKTPKPSGAPVVVAEEGDTAPNIHYYVVWDRFQGVDEDVRSKIVFEAVKRGRPKDYRGLITALGLTTREAIAMGVPGYEGALAGNR